MHKSAAATAASICTKASVALIIYTSIGRAFYGVSNSRMHASYALQFSPVETVQFLEEEGRHSNR